MSSLAPIARLWFFPVAGIAIAALGHYLHERFKPPPPPQGFVCFNKLAISGRDILGWVGNLLFFAGFVVASLFTIIFVYLAIYG